MKKTYLPPKAITVVVSCSTILQGSGVYTDDPQDVGSALVKDNALSSNVWDDIWGDDYE